MKPITLQGVKIVESRRLKQAGLMRYTIELTQQDSLMHAGTLALAEVHGLCFNCRLDPLEVEGNNNATTSQTKELIEKQIPKNETIYRKYYNRLVEYHGGDRKKAAEELRKHHEFFQVAHLEDLVAKFGREKTDEIMNKLISEIDAKMFST